LENVLRFCGRICFGVFVPHCKARSIAVAHQDDIVSQFRLTRARVLRATAII
jgi:hypothetical protein